MCWHNVLGFVLVSCCCGASFDVSRQLHVHGVMWRDVIPSMPSQPHEL